MGKEGSRVYVGRARGSALCDQSSKWSPHHQTGILRSDLTKVDMLSKWPIPFTIYLNGLSDSTLINSAFCLSWMYRREGQR